MPQIEEVKEDNAQLRPSPAQQAKDAAAVATAQAGTSTQQPAQPEDPALKEARERYAKLGNDYNEAATKCVKLEEQQRKLQTELYEAEKEKYSTFLAFTQMKEQVMVNTINEYKSMLEKKQ